MTGSLQLKYLGYQLVFRPLIFLTDSTTILLTFLAASLDRDSGDRCLWLWSSVMMLSVLIFNVDWTLVHGCQGETEDRDDDQPLLSVSNTQSCGNITTQRQTLKLYKFCTFL